MFNQVLNSISRAAKAIVAKPLALILGLVLYLGLLASVYLFVVTTEATVTQLALTPIAAIAFLLLFFALQSVAVRYTRMAEGFGAQLKRTLVDCGRLLAASLPVLVIGVAGLFLFALVQWLMTRNNPSAEYGFTYTRVIPWLQFLFLSFVMPLLAIQVWIRASRDGVGAALKSFGRSFARGFSLRSIVTYLIIFVVFGAISYLLIYTRTPVSNPWVDIGLLGARLVAAGLLVFLGWFLAVGALTEATEEA